MHWQGCRTDENDIKYPPKTTTTTTTTKTVYFLHTDIGPKTAMKASEYELRITLKTPPILICKVAQHNNKTGFEYNTTEDFALDLQVTTTMKFDALPRTTDSTEDVIT